MRRLWTSLLTVCLALVTVGVGTSSANAASAVTISKIATKTAPYKGKATVKPKVSKAKGTKVVSTRLTVKQGSRTIAKNKTSAKLAAGTYKVTTTVKYKTSRVTKRTVTTTKNVVTVESFDETSVTCVATNVDSGYGWIGFDATCTGAAFDGSVTLRNFSAVPDGSRWYGIDDDSNFLRVAALPTVGKTFKATLEPGTDLHKKKQVRSTKTTTAWSSTKAKTRTQTLVIKQGKKPNHAEPYSNGECPSWAPVKGNADSGIYHVPGGRWYKVTIAEECFTSASAARAHGYRASRNG